jgi:carbamate kinase
VPHLADIIEDGWGLVVSHGNGPQVGFILRRSEIAKDEVDTIPVDYAVADTQGAIGYMFVKALTNELTVARVVASGSCPCYTIGRVS